MQVREDGRVEFHRDHILRYTSSAQATLLDYHDQPIQIDGVHPGYGTGFNTFDDLEVGIEREFLDTEVTCLTSVVHPGDSVLVKIEIANLTAENQHFLGHLNLIQDDGTLWSDVRRRNASVAPNGLLNTTIGISIPEQVPSQWKDRDLTWNMVVDDLVSGHTQSEDSCVWRIQDPQ